MLILAPNSPITIGTIAAALGQSAPGDAAMVLTGVNSLVDATATEVSFLTSDQFLKQFAQTKAALVLVPQKVNLPPGAATPVLHVDDPELSLATVLGLFAPQIPRPDPGVDPSARISAQTRVPADARIGPHASIGARVKLGARCVIHPGVVIADDVTIGDDCEFFSNVVIRERNTVGHRVIINAGSIIGTDGFGYRWDGHQHVKVPQIGIVIIEDDVEIGSCSCVDRAKFGATVIGRGTKIDNLVQVGHNVKIGPFCIIVGQTGIAGSTTLGTGVVLGGAVSVRDHITIGDGAMAAARSAIHGDIPAKTVVSGMPALPHRQTLREQHAFRKLPELMTQMRKIQDRFGDAAKMLDQD